MIYATTRSRTIFFKEIPQTYSDYKLWHSHEKISVFDAKMSSNEELATLKTCFSDKLP